MWGDRSFGCETEIQRMHSVYGFTLTPASPSFLMTNLAANQSILLLMSLHFWDSFSTASVTVPVLSASKLAHPPPCLHALGDFRPARFHRIATTLVKFMSDHSIPLTCTRIPTQTKHTSTLVLIIEFGKPHFFLRDSVWLVQRLGLILC